MAYFEESLQNTGEYRLYLGCTRHTLAQVFKSTHFVVRHETTLECCPWCGAFRFRACWPPVPHAAARGQGMYPNDADAETNCTRTHCVKRPPPRRLDIELSRLVDLLVGITRSVELPLSSLSCFLYEEHELLAKQGRRNVMQIIGEWCDCVTRGLNKWSGSEVNCCRCRKKLQTNH